MTPNFYYRIMISMIRCNFLQSFKNLCGVGSEPPQSFENLSVQWMVTLFRYLADHLKEFQTITATKETRYFVRQRSRLRSKGPSKVVRGGGGVVVLSYGDLETFLRFVVSIQYFSFLNHTLHIYKSFNQPSLIRSMRTLQQLWKTVSWLGL